MFFKFSNPESHYASAYALLEGTGEVSDHKCTSASHDGLPDDMRTDLSKSKQVKKRRRKRGANISRSKSRVNYKIQTQNAPKATFSRNVISNVPVPFRLTVVAGGEVISPDDSNMVHHRISSLTRAQKISLKNKRAYQKRKLIQAQSTIVSLNEVIVEKDEIEKDYIAAINKKQKVVNETTQQCKKAREYFQ